MSSLRSKILTPFLLGSLALTTFLSFYTHNSAQKTVEESILLTAKAQTRHVHKSMSVLFRTIKNSVEKAATDPYIVAPLLPRFVNNPELAADAKRRFEHITRDNDYYRSLLLLDASGTCAASSNPMQTGISYAKNSYVKAALGGESTLSEVGVDMPSGNLTATAAAPVYADGKVVGAVVVVNDFPEIVRYDDTGNGEAHQAIFTALLTSDGAFIAHRNAEIVDQGPAFKDLYIRLSALKQGDKAEYILNGKSYTGYAVMEDTTGWIILSSGLNSEVFRFAQDISAAVFAVSFIALCLISFIVIQIVNGVLGSLLSLIEYARKVAEGDLTLKPAGTRRADELGVLHGALQTMVGSMQTMVVRSQEASRMKSEFLANMSHEIRTPLNAVIGMAYLYLTDNDSYEKKRDYIVKIQVAAKSLLGIINNILDISKIEAGMFDLDQIPFNLRDAVEQLLTIHRDNALAKGLELSMEYAEDLPHVFTGDPVRVGQVLNNLAGNALKFTEKGSVCIRCVIAAPANDVGRICVKITVADTGLGIPEEKLQDLFKPFTQADASITRRFGGTGLGLAISDKIVQMMGGAFSVQSRPGVGTDFSFTMLLEPREEEIAVEEEQDTAEAFRQLRLEGKRILVAEDNDINQLVMEELLRPTGAEVVMADNGLLAVEAATAGAFDLIFMDMQMPEMDGIQASREIRKFAPYDVLPIVAVTANAMKDEKEQGFAAGLNDYITKPIEPQQLISALRRWIR